ncbi:MAG: hypothetical protein RIR77_1286 [Planctomycetota bacterium]
MVGGTGAAGATGATVAGGVVAAAGVAAGAAAGVTGGAAAGAGAAAAVPVVGGAAAGVGVRGSGAFGGVSEGSWHQAGDVAESPINRVTAATLELQIRVAKALLSMDAS